MDSDITLTEEEERKIARELVNDVAGQLGFCLWLSSRGTATGEAEVRREWKELGNRVVDLLEFSDET